MHKIAPRGLKKTFQQTVCAVMARNEILFSSFLLAQTVSSYVPEIVSHAEIGSLHTTL